MRRKNQNNVSDVGLRAVDSRMASLNYLSCTADVSAAVILFRARRVVCPSEMTINSSTLIVKITAGL